MYTSQSNIESALGRALTTEEVSYYTAVLAPSIASYIESETGTIFASSSESAVTVSGDDTSLLIIPTMQTVTSVEDEDGEALSVADYSLYPSTPPHMAIKSKDGTWTKGLGNNTVNGKLGYVSVPDDIVKIATDLAVGAYSVRTDGVKSLKVGDMTESYETTVKSLSNDSLNILTRYKRLSRAI